MNDSGLPDIQRSLGDQKDMSIDHASIHERIHQRLPPTSPVQFIYIQQSSALRLSSIRAIIDTGPSLLFFSRRPRQLRNARVNTKINCSTWDCSPGHERSFLQILLKCFFQVNARLIRPGKPTRTTHPPPSASSFSPSEGFMD